jgi:hypothetical protein
MRGLLFAAGVAAGLSFEGSVASAATLTASQIAATYSALGYHIQSIELNDTGTVYEIQATAPNGFPVELFADAATGSQVGSDGGGGGVLPGTKGDDVADNSETGDGVDTSGDGDTATTDGGGTNDNGGGDSGDSGTGDSGDGGSGGGGDD